MIDIQKILAALGSPIRREILWLIWDEELAAGSICGAFDVTAPTISGHLAVLRDAGLVTVRSAGTFRYYRAHQDTLRSMQSLLPDQGVRWTPADNLPERAMASAHTGLLVTASTTVRCDRADAFRGFTDPQLYSRWLGVPVSLDADGNFACTMEWGTTVRGRYTAVCPPVLIAMRWDFQDDTIPVPGGERDAYAQFADLDGGCQVRVHQVVADEQQARFMQAAWSMVLGRLTQNLAAALDRDAGTDPTQRPRRTKLADGRS